MRTTAIRGTAVAVLLSATALGLSGCVNAEQPAPAGAGDSVSYGPPPSTAPVAADTQHNQADVTFVTQAVLLHQQVVSMAYLAGTGSTDPKLKALATEITSDQTPQVNTLIGWLTQWHQTIPTVDNSQTSQLQALKGASFNTEWTNDVRANLGNSQQAVSAELAQGSSAEAKQVAQQWSAIVRTELTKLGA